MPDAFPFRWQVSAADIARGVLRSCKLCPLAISATRAIRRQTGRNLAVWVGSFGLSVEDLDTGRTLGHVPLPAAAREWTARFDRSGASAVEPAEFEVELPARLLAANNQPQEQLIHA